MPSVVERFKNTKARTLLILGIIIVLFISAILYFFLGSSTPSTTQPTTAASIPSITAIPGGVTSERYQQLQEEENKRRAEAARQAGTSEVATIIGGRGTDETGRESFGIEDLLSKQCQCPPGGEVIGGCPPEKAADLLAQIQADNTKAGALIKDNPCLLKNLCSQAQTLAVEIMAKDPEAAKQLLNDCPQLTEAFAEKYPEAFKKLMLENPELASKLAAMNPELFKQLMLEDPEFARRLAEANPALVKKLMLDDPVFARKLAAANPALVKKLMLDDPEFARQLAATNPDLVKKLMLDDPEFAKALAKANPDLVAALVAGDPNFAAALRAKTGIDMAAAAAAAGALTEAEARQLTEQQKNQLQTLVTAMENQARSMFQAWNEFTAQQFVQGEWVKILEEQEKKQAVIVEQQAVAAAQVKPVLFKAGTVLFAVLDTTISSDEPGPILATVVEGQYRGSKLLGTFTAAPQPGGLPAEKVILNFTTMNIPDAPASIPVQAVAIDPETARTALATDVDHHFLLRYGTIFASAFLVGYAKVLTSQGSVQTTSANGLSTTTTSAQLSGRQQVMAALGEVGKKLGESWKLYANIPPTITVEACTGIGILFLADVSG